MVSNVLDTDSNNIHLTSAKFDCEAMSSVPIFSQPVVAPFSENPLYFILWWRDILPVAVACGPHYFRLRKAFAI